MQVEKQNTSQRLAFVVQSQNRYEKYLNSLYEDIAVTYKESKQHSCLYLANLLYG